MGGGGGKGGGGSPFVMPTYTDPVSGKQYGSSDDLNAGIDARTAADKVTSDAATAKTTADAAQKEKDFQTQFGTAKTQATSNVNDFFRAQGADPSAYSSQIANKINTAAGNVEDLNPNPAGSFAPTLGSDLFNEITAGKQQQNLNSYNADFGPNYSQLALPDTLIDPATAGALSSQFDPLADQLTNAQKRGTLSGTGYDAALKALSTAQTSAKSTVDKLGQGVLASDRSGLDTYLGGGRTAAGSAPLTYDFTDAPYKTGAESMVGRDTANFGGDVLNAVGNTKFSDITQLLNAGGNVQGATQPTSGNPAGAVGPGGDVIGGGDLSPSYLAAQAIARQKRGIGTQGEF